MEKLSFAFALVLAPIFMCAQEWYQIESYPGLGRNHPITFSIGDYGYVMAGQSSNDYFVKDVYRYDAVNNLWEQLGNFPGFPRGYSYGIAHQEKAYVGFGKFDMGPLNDWWTYDLSIIDIEEPEEVLPSLYPNPTSDFVFLPEVSDFEVFDLEGKLVAWGTANKIDMTDLKPGAYLVKAGAVTSTVVRR